MYLGMKAVLINNGKIQDRDVVISSFKEDLPVFFVGIKIKELHI